MKRQCESGHAWGKATNERQQKRFRDNSKAFSGELFLQLYTVERAWSQREDARTSFSVSRWRAVGEECRTRFRSGMADRERRGMLIKNNGTDEVQVEMASRTLAIEAGEEVFITPEEVRDPSLREALQGRSIAIVRPATQAEDEALRERMEAEDD
jgi:hypothetical protein